MSPLEFSAEKFVAIYHEVSRNSRSIAPIFVGNIGGFGKLKIIGLDQFFLEEALNNLAEFWQRQVFKFEALILSIVTLWFKSITKKLETWLSPVGRAYKASISLL